MNAAQGGLGSVLGRFKGVMDQKENKKIFVIVGGILLVLFILWMSVRK